MAELFRNLTLFLMTEKCFDKFFVENDFMDGEEAGGVLFVNLFLFVFVLGSLFSIFFIFKHIYLVILKDIKTGLYSHIDVE